AEDIPGEPLDENVEGRTARREMTRSKLSARRRSLKVRAFSVAPRVGCAARSPVAEVQRRGVERETATGPDSWAAGVASPAREGILYLQALSRDPPLGQTKDPPLRPGRPETHPPRPTPHESSTLSTDRPENPPQSGRRPSPASKSGAGR